MSCAYHSTIALEKYGPRKQTLISSHQTGLWSKKDIADLVTTMTLLPTNQTYKCSTVKANTAIHISAVPTQNGTASNLSNKE